MYPKYLKKKLFDRLHSEIETKLHPAQFGFRKNKSAILQLLLFQGKYLKTDIKENSDLRVLYIDSVKPSTRIHVNHLYQKSQRQEWEGRTYSSWPATSHQENNVSKSTEKDPQSRLSQTEYRRVLYSTHSCS